MDPPKLPRKMRFAPKPPPKREPKLVLPKEEKKESDFDDAERERLLHRLNETSFRRPKAEKKTEPVEVAFGESSFSISSYGAHKNKGSSSKGGDEKTVEKEYQAPWDYYSNYPVTLPLRPPYSGNPELHNEEEFGENSKTSAYDEDEINAAEELGLLEEDMENKMLFLKLPSVLPSIKQHPQAGEKPSDLKSLPAGFMGKMLVYKSGTVKLKLGDIIYDVSPGVDCSFPQDVVAVNTKGKHCCNLGEISKRAVVTPDIDHLLDHDI